MEAPGSGRWAAGLAIVVLLGTFTMAGPADAEPEGSRPVLTDVTQVATGLYHTCARLSTGRARCWGDADMGQIGNGGTTDVDRATTVVNVAGTGPLLGVVQVVTGRSHSCARLNNGEARCWGRNHLGQLGDASTTNSSRPVVVRSVDGLGRLTGVTQLAAGRDHTCARVEGGQVRCWGDDLAGQQGTGTSSAGSSLPRVVRNVMDTGPLLGVTQIDTGRAHTCARLSTGAARCWGADDEGQLGNGPLSAGSVLPAAVKNGAGSADLGGVAQISTGEFHTCARLTNGQARCWGYGGAGEHGDGDSDSSQRPVVVRNGNDTAPLTTISQLNVGYGRSCVRLTSGQARCWGGRASGALGDGDGDGAALLPVAVRNSTDTANLQGVAQVEAGYHGCARLTNQQLRCWGYGEFGQIGDGGSFDRPLPVLVVR